MLEPVAGSVVVPFVGRSTELDRLRGLLDDVGRGVGRLAVIEGDAGIGKSRLLAAMLDEARRSDFRLFTAAARDLERERSFGLIVDTLGLRTEATDPLQREIAGLIEDATTATDSRFRIVERICELVETTAVGGPVVVAVEDLHWADPSSVLALDRIARTVEHLSVLIVCTLRVTPRTAEVTSLLETLDQAGAARLALDPLDDGSVSELIEATIGATPGPQLRAKVAGASGNPLFITELLTALGQEGLIDTSGGTADVADVSTPPSLALTILRRLAFLSEESLEALRVASVLGTAFSLKDLCVVMGRSAVDVLTPIAEAQSAGLLREDDDLLAFRHDLVRDAIYEDMLQPIRKALHAQAANALANAGAPAAQVATHASIGADVGDADAIEWLVRAANEALGRSPTVATELLERAHALAAKGSERADELGMLLAVALLQSGRPIDAEHVAREVLARAPSREIRNEVRRSLFRALEQQVLWEDAVAEIDDALSEPGLTPIEEARLVAARADAMHGYDRQRARPEAERAIELGKRAGDPLAVFVGTQTLAFCNGFDGYIDDAIRVLDLANADPDIAELRDSGRIANPHVNRTLYLVWGDRFDEANREIDALGADVPNRETIFVSTHYVRAHLDLWAGRWDEAVAYAEAIIPVAEEQGFGTETAHLVQIMAYVAIHRDDLSTAERHLRKIPTAFWVPTLLAEARGDAHGLRGWLDAYRRQGVNNPLPWHMSLATWWGQDWVRLYLDAGDRTSALVLIEMLEEAARRVQTPSAAGAALRSRGMYENDPEMLLAAVDSYRAGPRVFDRAQACESAAAVLSGDHASTDQAIALLEEALGVYEAVGALRDISRADALLRGLGVRRGRRGPRNRPKSGWESLTESEGRVTEMVGEGLSYREIGERLFISRRTVETHVAHVFLKLGLSSRRELAELVRGRGA